MQQILSVVQQVAVVVLVVSIMGSVLRGSLNEDWRNELIISIGWFMIMAVSLTRLLAFGQSSGWTDGLWTTLYAFLGRLALGSAKRLYALQRGEKENK